MRILEAGIPAFVHASIEDCMLAFGCIELSQLFSRGAFGPGVEEAE